MTYIPVMVKVVDEVVDGMIDIETPDIFSKITSCYYCGSLLFYQVVSKIENTEHVTDIEIYCAVCGKNNGGIFHDPFGEVESLKGQEVVKHEAEVVEDERI